MSNFVASVVEDDLLHRELVADLLKDEGLEVIECGSAEAAELVLTATGPNLVVLVADVNLSGKMSGLELAELAKRRFPRLNVVLISGMQPPYVPQDTRFLLKPYRQQRLAKCNRL